MPHIALNAHLLHGGASYRSAGIHQYIDNLLRCLPVAAPEFRYTVFVGAGRPHMAGAAIRRSRWPTHRPPVRILWEQVVQPLELLRARPDLLHSLAFASPVLNPSPAVVTVFDLSFRLTPDKFPRAQRLYLSTLTAHSCRRAQRVIAISESTRRDVVRLLGIDPARVDVAYPGVDPHFRPLPAAEVEAFRARRGLPARLILYLGTLEPRKNLHSLISAFSQLRSSTNSNSNLQLILAGAKGWWYESLFQQVEALNLKDVVHFPGFVPAEELALWYNAASAFAYPSSFEGFGLPVLEALACGCAVVTSNVSSLPEAAGEAALTVAPDDAAALAEALRQALTPQAAERARQLGPEHAARFTWEAAARQTAESYRRGLAER
jgi:glycosyltransferase involved in cell wall biosynthesis